MSRRMPLLKIGAVLACAAASMLGIASLFHEPPIPVEPAIIGYDLTRLDRSTFPAATQRVYDAMLANRLSGSSVSDYRSEFSAAQRIEQRGRLDYYHFQLMYFDRPYEDVEGLPMMYVLAERKTRKIVRCGISVPCF